MTIKIMKNGIKCDKTLIKGIYYIARGNHYCFDADRSIALQFISKRNLTKYSEGRILAEEMAIKLGVKIEDDTDIMTDYFDSDRMYFAPKNPYYNLISAELKEAQRKHLRKEIENYEKHINCDFIDADIRQKLLRAARQQLLKLDTVI